MNMNPTILLYIIKLVCGGLVAFCAILLLSKTRDAAWVTVVAGFLLAYLSLVYDLLCEIGVFTPSTILVLGIPLSTLLGIALPSICFIVAFLLMFFRR